MHTRRCFVLVDWWGQARQNFFRNKHASAGHNSEATLRNIEDWVEKRLAQENEQPRRWDVLFRVYAGWLNGNNATPALKDYEALEQGYANARRVGRVQRNVLFMPGVVGLKRGDRLLSDQQGRRVQRRLGVHFPFTLRTECACALCQKMGGISPDGFRCERMMEKQVDTAIVADAITLSIDQEKAKILILSNDDDMLPALVAGEALGGDISILNTVDKSHIHAAAMKDLIFGPRNLGT